MFNHQFVCRINPKFLVMLPSITAHYIILIVPVFLTLIWMINHDSVRLKSLPNSNSDCSWLWTAKGPEICIMRPPSSTHIVFTVIPMLLSVRMMIKAHPVRIFSSSKHNSLGTWLFFRKSPKTHHVRPSIEVKLQTGLD